MRIWRSISFAALLVIPGHVAAIEAGFSIAGERWNHVVRLVSETGSCSATLITRKIAITAAHCVTKSNWSAKILGGPQSAQNVGLASLLFVDPRYDSTNYIYDVAILKVELVDGFDLVLGTSQLLSSPTYAQMLAGTSPFRTALVTGYGIDERESIGARKAALVEGITPNVGPQETLWASWSKVKGVSMPGDSGGGIYLLDPTNAMFLVAVVSGSNSIESTIGGDTFVSTVERYSPVAPSLCAAPRALASELGFDTSACARIEQMRASLSVAFSDMPLHSVLWAMRLMSTSPQRALYPDIEIEQQLALRALALGSTSPGVVDHVIEFLEDNSRDSQARADKRQFSHDLSEALDGRGLISRRHKYGDVYADSPSDLAKILIDSKTTWSDSNRRADFESRKRGEACLDNNCLLRLESAPRLRISAAAGNWEMVFPRAKAGVARDEGLAASRELTCKVYDYLLFGRPDALRQLLSSVGIAESSISESDSPASKSIVVKDSRMTLNAEYAPAYETVQIRVEGVRLSESDISAIVGAYRAMGFTIDDQPITDGYRYVSATYQDGHGNEFYFALSGFQMTEKLGLEILIVDKQGVIQGGKLTSKGSYWGCAN